MSERIISSERQFGIAGVIDDLRRGFAMGPVWRSFAWDEIQNRYRRSAIGIAWIAISYAFFVIVIHIFFRGLTGSENVPFLVHVAMGFAAFTFMTGNLADGAEVFRSAGNWIKSAPLPYSIYVFKSISRSLFTFAIQFLMGLVIITGFGWRPTPQILMVIPAIAIFIVNAVSIQIFIGLYATRYRDLSHLIQTIMRILFFMTPIIWTMDQQRGPVLKVAMVNPFTHFVEIFRAPIIGVEPMAISWPYVLIMTVVVWILALVAGGRLYRRLPFWL